MSVMSCDNEMKYDNETWKWNMNETWMKMKYEWTLKYEISKRLLNTQTQWQMKYDNEIWKIWNMN